MNKFIFIIAVFLGSSANAQLSIESSFNSTHIGRNQNLLVKYQWGRISANAGAKYSFNNHNAFPNGFIYKKSFWASTGGEHAGFETGLQIKILRKENFDLFGFYQLQLTKSHIAIEWDHSNEKMTVMGPWWALENNFGLGLNIYFTKSLYLTQKLGLGMAFYRTYSQPNLLVVDHNWEFCEMLSLGLGWRFVK